MCLDLKLYKATQSDLVRFSVFERDVDRCSKFLQFEDFKHILTVPEVVFQPCSMRNSAKTLNALKFDIRPILIKN
jgi:hypothetical protein